MIHDWSLVANVAAGVFIGGALLSCVGAGVRIAFARYMSWRLTRVLQNFDGWNKLNAGIPPGGLPSSRLILNEKGEALADCTSCGSVVRPNCSICHGSGSFWTHLPGKEKKA